MSIQDDIFDVEHALDGMKESESFERVYTYLADLERELEAYRGFHRAVIDLKMAIQKIESHSHEYQQV